MAPSDGCALAVACTNGRKENKTILKNKQACAPEFGNHHDFLLTCFQ
jgi:hypothetical protein